MKGCSASVTGALAFMGGTFDPIHNGHLRTALELQQQLQIDEVRLVPCQRPVHRESPGCDAQQRLAMIRLAVAGEEGLTVDDREITSSEPSYTVNTLRSIRAEVGGQVSISLIMGMDAYLTLPSWYRWQEIVEQAHILVVQRPGWEFVPDLQMADWTRTRQAKSAAELKLSPAGRVLLHRLTPLGISATQIRGLVAMGISPRYLIPDAVWEYIQDHRLYAQSNV